LPRAVLALLEPWPVAEAEERYHQKVTASLTR
jgi:hypothetical protein